MDSHTIHSHCRKPSITPNSDGHGQAIPRAHDQRHPQSLMEIITSQDHQNNARKRKTRCVTNDGDGDCVHSQLRVTPAPSRTVPPRARPIKVDNVQRTVEGHRHDNCREEIMKCVHCGGPHESFSRTCPKLYPTHIE